MQIVREQFVMTERGERPRMVGKCDKCGREVLLYGFTNTCDCGAEYNMSGQRLADRSQWGEETGESASDILDADYNCEPW